MRKWWCRSDRQGRKPDQDLRKSQGLIWRRKGSDKGSCLEERDAQEMAMLISFVNNLAPGTANDIDIHFPDSFRKSDKETWLEFNKTNERLVHAREKTKILQTGVALETKVRNRLGGQQDKLLAPVVQRAIKSYPADKSLSSG